MYERLVLSDDENKVSYSELAEARRPTVEFYLPGHFPVTGFLCHSHTTTGGPPLFPTLLAPSFKLCLGLPGFLHRYTLFYFILNLT